MVEVAKRVGKYSHVIGFDSFNEPSSGFIGLSLDSNPETIIPPGQIFTPYAAMRSAHGQPTSVPVANSIGVLTQRQRVNKEGVSVWLDGVEDVWQKHGIWTPNNKKCLQPKYFLVSPSTGKEVVFFRDYLNPFMVAMQAALEPHLKDCILFAEGDAFGEECFYWPSQTASPRVVNATHWYDGFTLFTRRFNEKFTLDTQKLTPKFGRKAVAELHKQDLSKIMHLPVDTDGSTRLEMPTLIGEFGIPYDMNNKAGFKTGNFGPHIAALHMYYDIFDELGLHSTQWNYCLSNSNQWGDDWNLEDLSVFSVDQQKEDFELDPDSGARALLGFSRPYAPKICGSKDFVHFTRKGVFSTRLSKLASSTEFNMRYFPFPANYDAGNFARATVVFLPDSQFLVTDSGKENRQFVSLEIIVQGGTYEVIEHDGYQKLYLWATRDDAQHVVTSGVTCSVSIAPNAL